jgi:hypothetical protein
MEGNFYVSPDKISSKLRTNLGQAYGQCKVEAETYAKCLEGHHINKAVKKDGCRPEREAMDQCVGREWKRKRAADGPKVGPKNGR